MTLFFLFNFNFNLLNFVAILRSFRPLFRVADVLMCDFARGFCVRKKNLMLTSNNLFDHVGVFINCRIYFLQKLKIIGIFFLIKKKFMEFSFHPSNDDLLTFKSKVANIGW